MSIFERASKRMSTAKLSHELVGGLPANDLAPDVMVAYIRERLISIYADTPYGLRAKDVVICTPEERAAHGFISSRRSYDITESYLYLVKVLLTLNGRDLDPRYLFLTYTEDGAIIKLSNTLFGTNPVMKDKFLSPAPRGLFIRFLRNKVSISTLIYSITKNDYKHETSKVLIGNIYSGRAKGGAQSSLLAYMMAKYGYSEATKRILGYTPELLRRSDVGEYDKDQHTVYSSNMKKPTTLKVMDYIPSDICVKVTKEQERNSPELSTVLVSLYYIIDHAPGITIENLESTDSMKLILGEIIFGSLPINRVMESVQNHLTSLDNYVDGYMVMEIHNEFGDTLGEDFTQDGFYKVLTVILRRYYEWSMAANEISASCYDKQLEVLYFITYDIFKAFTELNFQLTQTYKRYNNHIKSGALIDKLNKKITKGLIYKIRSGNSAVSPILYSGDHKYYKLTSQAQLQLNIPSGVKKEKKKNGGDIADVTTKIHYSQCVCGSINSITKSRLAPARALNIFAPYDPELRVIKPDRSTLEGTFKLREVIKMIPDHPSIISIPIEFDRYR